MSKALENAIKNIPHVSACTLDMAGLIRGEIQHRLQDDFSIVLLAADVVRVFVERLKLSYITAVNQAQC